MTMKITRALKHSLQYPNALVHRSIHTRTTPHQSQKKYFLGKK